MNDIELARQKYLSFCILTKEDNPVAIESVEYLMNELERLNEKVSDLSKINTYLSEQVDKLTPYEGPNHYVG